MSTIIKLTLTLSLCILSLCAHSFNLERVDSKLLFLDNSCEAAKKSVVAITEWSESIGEQKSCGLTPVQFGNQCGFDITNCAPNLLVKYQGEFSPVDGPNCWNSALTINKVLPAFRYSSPEEMSFYMSSALCRPLENGEKRLPGDIGAIRDLMPAGGTLETHAFIYITDELVYSKNEYFSTVAYKLMGLEQVYSDFSVPTSSECRQNRIDQNSNCLKALAYFRCSSLNPSELDISTRVATAVSDITSFEQYFELTIMSGGQLDEQILTNFVSMVAQFIADLDTGSEVTGADHLFLIKSLRWRIFSISEQLGMLFLIRENQKLLDLSQSLHQYINRYSVN